MVGLLWSHSRSITARGDNTVSPVVSNNDNSRVYAVCHLNQHLPERTV